MDNKLDLSKDSLYFSIRFEGCPTFLVSIKLIAESVSLTAKPLNFNFVNFVNFY